ANGPDLCCDLRPPSHRQSTQLPMINGCCTRPPTGPGRHHHALRAFGEQLRQAVGEFGEPVQLWSTAGDTKAVAAAPEGSLDGMELGPPLNAFTVDLRGFGEDVQDAVDSLVQVIRFEELQCAGLKKCAAVV